jgi:hypothetical protein
LICASQSPNTFITSANSQSFVVTPAAIAGLHTLGERSDVVNLKEWLIVRPMKWCRVITCFTGTARLLDNPGDYLWFSYETNDGSFDLLAPS